LAAGHNKRLQQPACFLQGYAQPPSWLRFHCTPTACRGILLAPGSSDGLLVKRKPVGRSNSSGVARLVQGAPSPLLLQKSLAK